MDAQVPLHAVLPDAGGTRMACTRVWLTPNPIHAHACEQVWGEGNITVVNATTSRILGPQTINVTIRNGIDNRICESHAYLFL
jgi:hypothetical protein